MQYEYMTHNLNQSPLPGSDKVLVLNKYGEQGWRLCSSTAVDLVFVRAKAELNLLPDADLENATRSELKTALQHLRNVIRVHRDSRGHDRCQRNDLDLYNALPDKEGIDFAMPPLAEFIPKCIEYWQSQTKKE